jgi:hypothetical protein
MRLLSCVIVEDTASKKIEQVIVSLPDDTSLKGGYSDIPRFTALDNTKLSFPESKDRANRNNSSLPSFPFSLFPSSKLR